VNAEKLRALDTSTPLNVCKTVAGFAQKKKLLKENTMQITTARKDVYSRITATIVEYLEKVSVHGFEEHYFCLLRIVR
jgi:hypothetical protein